MSNPQTQSHQYIFFVLARAHDIEPSEVEALTKQFGNDFESIDHALDDPEPFDDENFDY